jgi:membrane protease YdiL (CAAX protease family)
LQLTDLHPGRFFTHTWRQIDAEREPGGMSVTIYVYLVAVFCLAISDLNYLGGDKAASWLFNFVDNPHSKESSPFLWLLFGWIKPENTSIWLSPYFELFNLAHWAFVKVFAYFVIPSIAIAVHPGLSFKNIGLTFKGFKSHAWIYGLLFAMVLLLVIAVSFLPSFSTYYPFYAESMRSPFDFWAWELMYICQFFALEFFFRGFMLQPVRKTMGASAILAMMVPYVMIHFGKPFMECMGAVAAGIVLGTLALKTRSIWAGFFIHCGIAISMDVAANLQNGGMNWLLTLF